MNDPAIQADIEVLKRDVQSINRVIEKLDLTIDKLAEVSNGLNRMLSVHEEQINRQHQTDKELYDLVEKRRQEAAEQYETLHVKMSAQKAELENQVDQVYEEIFKELREMRREQEEHHRYMAERISQLEKWKWFVVGASAAVTILLVESGLLDKLF